MFKYIDYLPYNSNWKVIETNVLFIWPLIVFIFIFIYIWERILKFVSYNVDTFFIHLFIDAPEIWLWSTFFFMFFFYLVFCLCFGFFWGFIFYFILPNMQESNNNSNYLFHLLFFIIVSFEQSIKGFLMLPFWYIQMLFCC